MPACPICDHSVDEKAIDARSLTAVCGACQSVWRVSRTAGGTSGPSALADWSGRKRNVAELGFVGALSIAIAGTYASLALSAPNLQTGAPRIAVWISVALAGSVGAFALRGAWRIRRGGAPSSTATSGVERATRSPSPSEPDPGAQGYRTAARPEGPPTHTLTWRWRSSKKLVWLVLGATLIGPGSLGILHSIARSKPGGIAYFGALLVAAWATLYAGIAGVFNRTTVRSDGHWLEVLHHPFPWLASRKLALDRLSRVRAVRRVHHGKTGEFYTFDVLAQTHDGRETALVRGLDGIELAVDVTDAVGRLVDSSHAQHPMHRIADARESMSEPREAGARAPLRQHRVAGLAEPSADLDASGPENEKRGR